jgi:glycine C-acetyltransferase
MNATTNYSGGENFSLRDVLLAGRHARLAERTAAFNEFITDLNRDGSRLVMRTVVSPADREVLVRDEATDEIHPMLMFGSNNYLGLATNQYVRDAVTTAMITDGVGVGGPPLLNGYTAAHRSLEQRLAALKGTEDAMLFSSGYGANVGLVTGLMNKGDVIIYDAYTHASFCDGMKMAGIEAHRFAHNDLEALEVHLVRTQDAKGDRYVSVEGIYSMDGDRAPLAEIVALCRKYGAILIVDDAHGTGVQGERGFGSAEACGVHGEIDITMGTFSKAFGMTGGFIAASREIIQYLRFFARSYMFSASLPPTTIAAVHAGLDVMEREPQRLATLRRNIDYAREAFQKIGRTVVTDSAIIPLRVPATMDIRAAGRAFHDRGIFLNAIEYPAVPIHEQRFRISIMATHTHEDIDNLAGVIRDVWFEYDRAKCDVRCAS